jgi:hypothetical protein
VGDQPLLLESVQLVAVEQWSGPATEYSSCIAAGWSASRWRAQHAHQRHDTAAAADELHRCGVGDVPDEPAAERSAHLHVMSGPSAVGEVRRDLTVGRGVDGDLDQGRTAGGGEGVGADRGVPAGAVSRMSTCCPAR